MEMSDMAGEPLNKAEQGEGHPVDNARSQAFFNNRKGIFGALAAGVVVFIIIIIIVLATVLPKNPNDEEQDLVEDDYEPVIEDDQDYYDGEGSGLSG